MSESTEIVRYMNVLKDCASGAMVTREDGTQVPLQTGVDETVEMARSTTGAGNKLMFVGNGGSAGICSHMATDYSKNGGLRSMALNDSSMLTCLSNDYGYEHVFEKQIEFFGQPGDLLIAISSSGKSENILNATAAALDKGCLVVTFSGFHADNPLRSRGTLNYFVESREYGFVEVSHLALCHAILDISMGWSTTVADQGL